MKQEALDWLFEHFMMDYSTLPGKKDYDHQSCAEAANRSSEALFATFTEEQNKLYIRFEEDHNELEALQLRLFFRKVFCFVWELMR